MHLLKLEEAAAHYCLKSWSLRCMARRHLVPFMMIAGRYYFSIESLDSYFMKQMTDSLLHENEIVEDK